MMTVASAASAWVRSTVDIIKCKRHVYTSRPDEIIVQANSHKGYVCMCVTEGHRRNFGRSTATQNVLFLCKATDGRHIRDPTKALAPG